MSLQTEVLPRLILFVIFSRDSALVDNLTPWHDICCRFILFALDILKGSADGIKQITFSHD